MASRDAKKLFSTSIPLVDSRWTEAKAVLERTGKHS